jgi:AcrR family transcriptional regulator
MGHFERKIRDKENIKNSILKAALDIAIAEGWQAVTIRRISDEIEYTTSIVYGHFESKDALLREITNNGFITLNQELEKVLSKEMDPKKQLLQLSLINWDFALNNKELYKLMFNFGKPSNENAIRGIDLIKEIFAKITGKRKKTLDSMMLNWICLRRGAINMIMEFQGDELDLKKLRELYIEFMERFISSLTLS